MVSRATKRFWKSVAIGLALSPVLAVENAVLAQTPAPTISAVKDDAGAAKPSDVDTVRQLVRDGRKALADGDKVKAEKLARQAVAMKVTMPFFETDTPEKLLIEIGVKATPPVAIPANADPKVLVKQGYDALKGGHLDEAQKLATAASANRTVKWGLFEDTPAKLLDEVQKARTARNKAESTKVLADARKAYDAGKLDDAEKLAYKASNLHGPYSVWDLSERPEKLIAEVQTAKDKQRKLKVPSVPGSTAVASGKASDKKADAPSSKPGEMPAAVAAKSTPPAPNWPTEVATADLKKPAGGVTTAAATVAPNAPSGVVQVKADANPAKAKATALVSEGKALQSSGRYLEARGKFVDAQKCSAEFGPTEVSPDMCLIELASAVMRQIDTTIREAQIGGASPDKMHECESKLKSSQELAIGFGLDTQPIQAHLMLLASASGKPTMPAAPSADSLVQGQGLLEKARMELKRGQCEAARQLATEVYNGPFGQQNEATALLRSIDVEEHNQRVLAANRNFDAAMAAFRGKDNGQCLAVLRQVDANLLSPDKRSQMKEVLLTCQKSEVAVAKAPALPATPPSMMPVTPSSPVQQATATGTPVAGIQQVGMTGTAVAQAPKPMSPTAEGDSLAAQVQAMQQIEYQPLAGRGSRGPEQGDGAVRAW
ncbi:MAG: hypothetical protein U0746_00645 [Gemmataceae bacterium]